MEYELLGLGGSSIVSAESGGKTALKGHQVWVEGSAAPSREGVVYQHLGEHPHILKCYGLVEVHPSVHSLRLERAPYGNVRQFIRNTRCKPPSEQDRLTMALGVPGGLAHVHAKNVIHCDISCRNLFLFPSGCVKIDDFGSALLDGTSPANDIVEEIRYELPLRGRAFEERPHIKRELFALGSAIYETMSWKMPFEELDDDDVEKMPQRRNVIRDCWNEKFETSKDVEKALMALRG
ncbi:kinase-like domain-containing protein [Leptodontidium sp. 2 PMI_412]|nr:kinase-like domain-containing protein [Leptodontidium sp. 2 PMI_412]